MWPGILFLLAFSAIVEIVIMRFVPSSYVEEESEVLPHLKNLLPQFLHRLSWVRLVRMYPTTPNNYRPTVPGVELLHAGMKSSGRAHTRLIAPSVEQIYPLRNHLLKIGTFAYVGIKPLYYP